MFRKVAAEGLAFAAPIAVLIAATAPARADLEISSRPTKNVTCYDHDCSATASRAVMNVTDLQTMLASNESVGLYAGGIAKNIVVNTALSWANESTLYLSAFNSVIVNKSVTITGQGGLVVNSRTGSGLVVAQKASITFWDLTSRLTINGANYQLANDLPILSYAMMSNPSGFYALARDYDASIDGVYSHCPVMYGFNGSFEGLGHKISNLTIVSQDRDAGLFDTVGSAAKLSNIVLVRSAVSFSGDSGSDAGLLAGSSAGTIDHAFASGAVIGGSMAFEAGGLVGANSGTISSSHVLADVSTDYSNAAAGGLAAINAGLITNSFAEGKVQVQAVQQYNAAGGIAGVNEGIIDNSYSLAKVVPGLDWGGGSGSYGGLVAFNFGKVKSSYAAGKMNKAKQKGGTVGGAAAYQGYPTGGFSKTYWDLDTGVSDPAQGAGNIPNYPGITGLTTQQLQSGLPDGFSPKVWGQDPDINNGLPYLLSNPPE